MVTPSSRMFATVTSRYYIGMKTIMFSTRPHDQESFITANHSLSGGPLEIDFIVTRLGPKTTCLAKGYDVVSVFVNDEVDAGMIQDLWDGGTRLLALRSAGFNHVDLEAANDIGMVVCRVPEYSPHAIAEHAIGLLLTLNRKLHLANARVHHGDFRIDGLMGFDLYGTTIGVIGTGKIGACFCRILQGFGANILAVDPEPNPELPVEYVSIERLLSESRVISLHCPLLEETRYLMDSEALDKMQPGAVIINTGRGALLDTTAVIAALKSGHIGALGIDVYEEESNLFFQDFSEQILQDDVFARLMTFPNVFITGHQGFFTEQAVSNIATTSLQSIEAFLMDRGCPHRVETNMPNQKQEADASENEHLSV